MSEIIRPFASLNSAMRAKDPDLYEKIRSMPFAKGARIWQEKYTDDFPKGRLAVFHDGRWARA